MQEDQAQDGGAAGAERDTDSYFAGTLCDRVGEHAVQADRGQSQGDAPKKPTNAPPIRCPKYEALMDDSSERMP